MKIYTKTGDKGETGLYGGARVSKSHGRIDAYGEVDELNAVLGLARTFLPEELSKPLKSVQDDLFNVGAELATPPDNQKALEKSSLVTAERTAWLEKEMDRLDEKLARLKTFILPGGSQGAAALHLARTVCRRAERSIVDLSRSEPVRAQLVEYMNRLSDYLFVLAREANRAAGVKDVPWEKPK